MITPDGVKNDVVFQVMKLKRPPHDMDTLFVGLQSLDKVIDKAEETHCEHIYPGAIQVLCPQKNGTI